MRGPPAVYCHPNLQREILEVSLNLLIDTFLLNISKFCLNTYYVYHSGQILLKVTICVISIFIKLYPLIATTLVFTHQGGTRCFCVYSTYTLKILVQFLEWFKSSSHNKFQYNQCNFLGADQCTTRHLELHTQK